MIGRACRHCGAKMKGRSDKMYCDTSCKNAYHSAKRSAGHSELLRRIDGILHKNHWVMRQLFEGEKRKHFKVPKTTMSLMGFDFSYHTGTYLNSKGKTYHYIYDYAWMEFSKQEIMVVRGKG